MIGMPGAEWMNPSQQDRRADALSAKNRLTSADVVEHYEDELLHSARAAMLQASQHLLQLQHRDGYWCGELEGDTILESEFILLLAFLGREKSKYAEKAARYLIGKQLPGGGWSMYPGGALDVSNSVKAYFALKITGHDYQAEYMRRARRAILNAKGADRVNSFTRFFLAILGQIDYDHCPAVPPEMVLLPTWFPINITVSARGHARF